MGWTGVGLLGGLLALAVLAPALTAHPPDVTSGRPFSPPGGSHLLGTDDLGRDLFAQLAFGTRVSLVIGTGAALFAVIVGAAVALVAGYHRGAVDAALMRVVDVVMAFPFIAVVVVLAAYFGRGLWTTIVVIAGVIWARPARVLRSQVLKVREYDHVRAARAMGASTARVIVTHVLPRTAPLAAVQFVRAANVAVLLEASLAFLGLGDPDRVSWGTTLYFAQARSAFLTDAWVWWIVPPGLALTLAVLGFAFLGYAIEEWADPRLAHRTATRARRRVRPIEAPRPDPSAPMALEVRGLTVEYRTPAGAARAVEETSLCVGRGTVVGLVGESGSGKTTLAMAVLGLLRRPGRVAEGTLRVGGVEVPPPWYEALRPVRGRDVALVPQAAMNALNPAYPILRQVAEAGRDLGRDEAKARAHEVLEGVGIPGRRHGAYPHELSGGMRQRAVIAMALVHEPALLVADEPVTGLDVVTQARIVDLLLAQRAERDLAVLLISHDLPMVARAADELVVMYGGRVVERGPAAVVVNDPAHPYTRLLLRAFPPLRGPRRPLVTIAGEPPDPLARPEGCCFAPRCPEAQERCRREVPVLGPAGRPGHDAACLLRERS